MLAHDEQLGAVRFGVTDREGGVSAAPYFSLNLADHVGDDPANVVANRRLLAARVGIDAGRLVLMAQPHRAEVATVRDLPATPMAVDAMVTDRAGLALTVLVADCAPVLLADVERGVIGVAHAGRRGLLSGVLPVAVEAMRALGARQILARVGPAICGRCYEVPAGMAARVADRVPAVVARTRWDTAGIDIRASALAELTRLGVEAVHAGACTFESASCFSFRREGVTGRFAAFAMLSA